MITHETPDVLTTDGTCAFCKADIPPHIKPVAWKGVSYYVCIRCRISVDIPDDLQRKSLTVTGTKRYRRQTQRLRQATSGGLHPRYLDWGTIWALAEPDRTLATLMGIVATIGTDAPRTISIASPTWVYSLLSYLCIHKPLRTVT